MRGSASKPKAAAMAVRKRVSSWEAMVDMGLGGECYSRQPPISTGSKEGDSCAVPPARRLAAGRVKRLTFVRRTDSARFRHVSGKKPILSRGGNRIYEQRTD